MYSFTQLSYRHYFRCSTISTRKKNIYISKEQSGTHKKKYSLLIGRWRTIQTIELHTKRRLNRHYRSLGMHSAFTLSQGLETGKKFIFGGLIIPSKLIPPVLFTLNNHFTFQSTVAIKWKPLKLSASPY